MSEHSENIALPSGEPGKAAESDTQSSREGRDITPSAVPDLKHPGVRRRMWLHLALILLVPIGIAVWGAFWRLFPPPLVGVWELELPESRRSDDTMRAVFREDGTGEWGRDKFIYRVDGDLMEIQFDGRKDWWKLRMTVHGRRITLKGSDGRMYRWPGEWTFRRVGF